jgi:hypothetical protein
MRIYFDIGESFGREHADELKRIIFEGWKYQIMWELRQFEDEMKEQGGHIVFHIKSQGGFGFQCNQFHPELLKRIEPILAEIHLSGIEFFLNSKS